MYTINKLTPEQALEVVMRLIDKGSAIRDAVTTEARNVLSEIDVDKVADDVFFSLDSIDVQECWDRAGKSRDGYTSPDEAAFELIEERLQPFVDQGRRYQELAMTDEQATYFRGMILGIYRFEHETESEFLEWAVDMPLEFAGALLKEWREGGKDSNSAAPMKGFIRDRCPNWARHLLGAEVPASMEVEGDRRRGTETVVAKPAGQSLSKAPYTAKQGQYLAFIYYYTKIHGRAPSEADMQGYFQVSPPSVHQMVLGLEKLGFIQRTPGQGRSVKLLLPRSQLPDLI